MSHKLSSRQSDREMQNLWYHLGFETLSALTLEFEMHADIDIINGWGYPVKKTTSPVDSRKNFGWSEDHVKLIREMFDISKISLIESILPSETKYDVMLSFPGAYTYGHWFVDVAPRIELILSYFELEDLSFIVPGPLPAWADPFLHAFGINDKRIIPISQLERYRSNRLILPSLSRDSDHLHGFPHGKAFQRIKKSSLSSVKISGQKRSRILVRHTPQTSSGQRAIMTNFDELERRLQTLGFITITPRDMTFYEQVQAFAEAEFVVGEDSSALHNVIFSTDTRLVVLNGLDRKNLLHLSIAHLAGHRCNYVFCRLDSPLSFRCDVEEVIELIV